MDALKNLANNGRQIMLTTHSGNIVKQLGVSSNSPCTN
ncbi:ATP-binding protein [Prevotella intermedia]|nr:ATP-binding protein [Prevotella intermedia]